MRCKEFVGRWLFSLGWNLALQANTFRPVAPLPVANLIRMDWYRNGVLQIVHVPRGEARHTHKQMKSEGWTLAYSCLV